MHEQQVEQAKIIQMFFDNLVSEKEHERELAFVILSSFVNPSLVHLLTSAMGKTVSLSVLSRLAATESGAADIAQRVLNERLAQSFSAVVGVAATQLGQVDRTGFFCYQDLIVTCGNFSKGTKFWLRRIPQEAASIEAICIYYDIASYIAVARVISQGAGAALCLYPQPLQLVSLSALQANRKGTSEESLDLEVHVVQSTENRGLIGRSCVLNGEEIESAVREGGSGFFAVGLALERGAEGAPLLNNDGGVIGVIVGSDAGGRRCRAVSADIVLKILKNGQSPTQK
jgi:hypothetical protein